MIINILSVYIKDDQFSTIQFAYWTPASLRVKDDYFKTIHRTFFFTFVALPHFDEGMLHLLPSLITLQSRETTRPNTDAATLAIDSTHFGTLAGKGL